MKLGTLIGSFILLAGRASISALEIPIEAVGAAQGTAVGFVDMEKIFQEFPETAEAKAEYITEVDRRRKTLLEKELELEQTRDRINLLKDTLAGAEPSASTGTMTAEPLLRDASAALALRQEELAVKEKALEEERLAAEQELVDYERRRSQAILGRIYGVLRELAEESQVGVVVDKSTILYGTPQIDLTEKLRERLRTR